MRIAFLLTVSAYAALLVAAGWLLPEQVPLHFGIGGAPDRWGSRTEALVIFALVGAGAAVLLGGGARLARSLPLRSVWVNLPHKDWWTATPEREQRARRELARQMYTIATATMVLVGTAVVLTVVAARRDDPDLGASGWVLLALVVVVLALAVRSHLAFRPEVER